MPDTRSAPTVGRIVLGLRLRDLRERAGVSFDEAAGALSVNPTTVRRMEKADVGLKPVHVKKLLQVYGVPQPECRSFLALVEEAGTPGWWHGFRDVLPPWFGLQASPEESADVIRAYAPHRVPELLQTEEYVRALVRADFPGATEAGAERRVAVRLRRQEVLGRPRAPRLWALLDEAVLRRDVGGPEVMRRQLDELAGTARHDRVTLQILPFRNGPHPGVSGPFQLFRFGIPELPDIVCTEGLTGAVFHDERPETTAHLEALDRMGAQAAPLSDTERILGDVRKEL